MLLLDADLGESAANCAAADRAGGRRPGRPDHRRARRAPATAERRTRGFGLVMTTAARGITELTGWTPRAPLRVSAA